MNKKRICKNCIWADKCAANEPCDFYESANCEERIAVEDYHADLKMREDCYAEQVEEQNS